MKLATRDDGSPGGRLLLVDPPLARAVEARACGSMIEALSDWDAIEPELRAEHAALASGDPADTFAFDPAACRAPLPNPAEFVVTHDPSPVRLPAADDRGGLEVQVDVAAALSALSQGADAEAAAGALRLVMLAAGFTRPGADTRRWRFAPVAVTPESLDGAWSEGRLQGTVELAAEADATAGEAATAAVDLPVLERVVAAARDRALPAGTFLGPTDPAARVGTAGPFRLDMRDGLGRSLFGTVACGGEPG